MIFNLITDITDMTTLQVAVQLYNLALLYFLWDIAKYVLHIIKMKLGGKKYD